MSTLAMPEPPVAETPDIAVATDRYARCIAASKRIRWDIDRDVIRGRRLDPDRKWLPDGLTLAPSLAFLDDGERRLMSRIQGRTYANMFGLVERFIGAKMLDVCRSHALGDQVAFEALIRFTDEELKHQELFRRIDRLACEAMPEAPYTFVPQAKDVADFVLGKSTWSVLALTCHIELFTQVHYRQSIGDDPAASPLFKDVFLFHWKEESQHAVLDELEWRREDARLDPAERDRAVDDLLDLVSGIHLLLMLQAESDARCFRSMLGRMLSAQQALQVETCLLAAYRWQYIVSGVRHPRFAELLSGMTDDAQKARIGAALASLMS